MAARYEGESEWHGRKDELNSCNPTVCCTQVAQQVATTPVLGILRDLLDDTKAVAAELAARGVLGSHHFAASVLLRHTMYYQLWHAGSLVGQAILAAATAASGARREGGTPAPAVRVARAARVRGLLDNATGALEEIFRAQRNVSSKTGNIFRVGIFLDFVRRSGTTRTCAPCGPSTRAGSQTNSN